ncbi:triose-phosphate isomerase [Candidatus Marinimicrobia bacterium]|nr:triose-phosphate isomerase [Candidatus Neomarinimicrobiota bacterium]MDC0383976.1 triose-phosphate isomerase [Candidatus Neomarinimicrobiota bacterium]
MSRKPIVAGNWKMHKNTNEGINFASSVQNKLLKVGNVTVIYAPPFTGLFQLKVSPPYHKSAQNCHWEEKGAFTGETSVSMIKACGAEYVIVGHSERRQYFGETDELVNKKISAIISSDLDPIFCIGETLSQRESGETASVLKKQICDGLNNIESLSSIIIAYEPVWAIGTGLTADAEQIEKAHSHIVNVVSELYKKINVRVLYGGSVNSNNADQLIKIPKVDGFLIGGASLDVESFSSIVQIVEDNEEKK